MFSAEASDTQLKDCHANGQGVDNLAFEMQVCVKNPRPHLNVQIDRSIKTECVFS